MKLLRSFVHNVCVHPLLFAADVLECLGLAPAVREGLDLLHEITAPPEGPPPGPAGEPYADDAPTPQPNPRTPATSALEWRPEPTTAREGTAPPLAGSARSRMRTG